MGNIYKFSRVVPDHYVTSIDPPSGISIEAVGNNNTIIYGKIYKFLRCIKVKKNVFSS